MSRIDDLIRQFAPRGVAYRALGDVAEVFRGKRFVKADMVDFGVPCIHYGEIYTKYGLSASASYSFLEPARAESLRVAQPGDLVVATAGETIGDIGNAVAWLGSEPVVIHDACYAIRSAVLDASFLSHLFRTVKFKRQIRKWVSSSKISSISTQNLSRAVVPVPPLEVQWEIVRILDVLAELEAELEVELEAELDARRRQFAHYRHALLHSRRESTEWTVLGDAAENLDSQRRPITKAARTAGEIPYYGASGVVDHVRDFIFDGEYLLVSEDGANLIARSTPIAFSISGKTWVNNHAHVLKFDTYTSHRFVEFYLNSIDLAPYTSAGPQPKLTKASLNRIPIPLPSPAEQERIVAILDTFDVLVNDLSSGLPAEIVARREEYAYYRDRLLTFEEAEA